LAEKKYYWLKFKEDFFDEDTIQWLEEQNNGKEYCLFYLKLCLKSLKTNGILIRSVGQILVPYDVKKLGEITNTDIDTVIVAMEVFKKIGLVQILDNGEIYLTQLKNMVGSESKWAKYKRKDKELEKIQHDSNSAQKTLQTEKEKELDIEKELDKEKDIEKGKDIEKELQQQEGSLSVVVPSNIKVFKHFEKCGFIVTAKLMEFIDDDIEIYSAEWVIDAANECVKRGKINNYGYLTGILQNCQTKGRDTQIKNESKVNASAYTQMKSIFDE